MSKGKTTADSRDRIYEQEALIEDANELIAELMTAQSVTKKELAKRIGKTPGFVSQVLSGNRNMTLRTFADLAFALGSRIKLDHHPVTEPRTYRTAPGMVQFKHSARDKDPYRVWFSSAMGRPTTPTDLRFIRIDPTGPSVRSDMSALRESLHRVRAKGRVATHAGEWNAFEDSDG